MFDSKTKYTRRVASMPAWRAAVALLLWVGLQAPVAAQAPAADAAAIKANIIGHTVSGAMTSGSAYREYYAPDGTIHGPDYRAKWRLDGNRMCLDYGGDAGPDCYQLVIDGQSVTWRLGGKTKGQGHIVAGNPRDL